MLSVESREAGLSMALRSSVTRPLSVKAAANRPRGFDLGLTSRGPGATGGPLGRNPACEREGSFGCHRTFSNLQLRRENVMARVEGFEPAHSGQVPVDS